MRWVHVSDLADLSGLLTGGELVLTTGQALADPAARDDYLPGLAKAGAVGVVIELGLHVDAIPESALHRGRRTRAAGDRVASPGALHRRHRGGPPPHRRRPVRRGGLRPARARGVHRAEHAPRLDRPDRRGHRRHARDAGGSGGPQPAGAVLRRAGHADGRAAGGLGAPFAAGGGGLVDGQPGRPVPRGVGTADRPGGRRRRLPDRDDVGARGPGAGAAPDGRAEPQFTGASGAERSGRRSAPGPHRR